MKKLIALLLVLCVCTALFVACQTSDTPDDPTPPSGDQGGNTPGGETPEKLGEQITAEQWAAMTAGGSNPFTNYTGVMKETDSDGAVTSVTVMLNGAEYIVTMQQGTMTMKFAAFLMDSELCYFTYNAETEKWVEQESESMMASMAKSYILAGCPYPFTQLVYNEETGVYTCSYLEDAEDTEPEQVEAIFKNGALVQMKVVEGSTLVEITGSDYGTTVVPRPTAEEIDDGKPSVVGAQLTAEQWAAYFANLPTNYTCKTNTTILGMTIPQLFKVTGDMYYISTSAFGISETYWGKIAGDQIIGYVYNAETGKWDYDDMAEMTYTDVIPFADLPTDYALYTYDAELGAYTLTVTEEEFSYVFTLIFENGNLVYISIDSDNEIFAEYLLSDFGTTRIDAPAEEDLMPPTEGGDDTEEDEFEEFYPITEEQFNALKTNSPTNYSYVETRYYNGELVVIERMIDGECFMDSQYDADGNLTRRWCCVKVGDRYVDYGYDVATGKWQEHNNSISSNYPLSGFPLALSNFVYDAEWGIYVYEMSETVWMEIAFDSEGNLCYIGQYDGENYSETYFSDYGTTVIEAPAAEDIIPGENDTNVNPDDDDAGNTGGSGTAALPGNNVGNLAYSADIPLLMQGGSFNVANNQGKVTVLNFWGAWCPPCRNEMPDFDRIATECAEVVTVFAVHTYPTATDTYNPVSYVNQYFPNSAIVFGVDDVNGSFYDLYGGDGYYPFTVIIDAEGIITYRNSGALSYEQLKVLINEALQ